MAYTAWSVVFGEQPSASKWNQLGTNDAGFRDGTLITNLAWNVTALSNPYKYSAYRGSTQTIGQNFTKIQMNTENFDTNSNYDNATNYRYTAPAAGFYFFNAGLQFSAAATYNYQALIYKNGSSLRGGNLDTTASTPVNTLVMDLISLATNDYIEIYGFTSNVGGANITGSADSSYVSGIRMSNT